MISMENQSAVSHRPLRVVSTTSAGVSRTPSIIEVLRYVDKTSPYMARISSVPVAEGNLQDRLPPDCASNYRNYAPYSVVAQSKSPTHSDQMGVGIEPIGSRTSPVSSELPISYAQVGQLPSAETFRPPAFSQRLAPVSSLERVLSIMIGYTFGNLQLK